MLKVFLIPLLRINLRKILFRILVPEGDYVCTLPPHLVEVARTELRETESRRNQALDQFRELIKLHPRIKKCQMGKMGIIQLKNTCN